jgi:hypothetical protein
MKTYITSSIILILTAASAMAMPTMMPRATGADPTAKNHEKLIKDLKLTDAEAEPTRKILADYRKDLAEWAAKNGPEIAACQANMKKYHQMRDAKVVAAIRKSMKRLGELNKEQVDKREAMLVKLKGVLPKEKYAQAADALRPRKRPRGQGFQERFHQLGKMKLTDGQLAKIKSLTEAAMKPTPDGSPRKGSPMQEAWKKIVDEVLTADNRTQLQDLMRKSGHRKMVLGVLNSVKLTADQSKQVNALWDKAYASAKSHPKSKFDIYRGARSHAIDKILTAEQRKFLMKMQAKPHGGSMGSKMPIPMPPVTRPH